MWRQSATWFLPSYLRRCECRAGAGLPFFLLTALGARGSTASNVTAINLGAPPGLITLATLAVSRGRRRPARVEP